jgi:hypothetical protein
MVEIRLAINGASHLMASAVESIYGLEDSN